MDTKVFVITHKEFEKPKDPIYTALHSGRALGEDLGYQGDNTGDNISAKNRNYCELTGLYWIWKNADCDVVGICHYRRYFINNEDFLNPRDIENFLENYDVILPESGETEYKTNREHYEKVHVAKDMEITREILLELYPDYVPAFDHFMNTNLASLANMIVTRKSVFDEYCEFLFRVLFELESRVDITDYDAYQARIFGFISERLLRIWIFMHSYRVKELEVRLMDPGDAENAVKTVELKHKMISIILRGIIGEYKKGNFYDVVDNSPLNVNLGDKIPVWICWWQGLDEAPDLVKTCVNSLKRNLPEDKTDLRIITLDNVGDYISLPIWIVERFEAGAITLTHLSDILRAGLLYRYGGLWIDATYYMTGALQDNIFSDNSFYTIKTGKIRWRADVVKGRWSGNFMKAEAGNLLFKFMLNAFYEYWNYKEDLVEYFLIDHIIDLAYENFPEVKDMIEGCPVSQPGVMDMVDLLNEVYSREAFEKLTKDTRIFKLNYKIPLYEQTLLGKETLYGHICKNNR